MRTVPVNCSIAWLRRASYERRMSSELAVSMSPSGSRIAAELFPNVRAVSITDQGLRYAIVLAARQIGA